MAMAVQEMEGQMEGQEEYIADEELGAPLSVQKLQVPYTATC